MENISIQDILIFILFIAVIYLLYRSFNTVNENFDSNIVSPDMLESIKNLGIISKSIMTEKGDLTIPANNTNIKGNLIVDGNFLARGNEYKTIIISCIIPDNYLGPILDSNGFSISSLHYWCKPPLYGGAELQPGQWPFKYNSELNPDLLNNTQKNEWWISMAITGIISNDNKDLDNIYIFEFIPIANISNDNYLPIYNYIQNNDEKYINGNISDKTREINSKNSGIRVATDPNNGNGINDRSISYFMTVKQNALPPRPYPYNK